MNGLINKLKTASTDEENHLIPYAIAIARSRGLITDEMNSRAIHCWSAGAYVQAAIELVPEGWQWDAGTYAPGEMYNTDGAQAAVHQDGDVFKYYNAEAATPALALTAATLTALINETQVMTKQHERKD